MRQMQVIIGVTSLLYVLPVSASELKSDVIRIGGFGVIHTSNVVTEVIYQGPPIGTIKHRVEVKWGSRDSRLKYELVDNGETLRESVFFDNDKVVCGGGRGLTTYQKILFSAAGSQQFRNGVLTAFVNPLCKIGNSKYSDELAEAQKAYGQVLIALQREAIQIFGQIDVRCAEVEQGFHYHGDVCAKYSGKSSDVPTN